MTTFAKQPAVMTSKWVVDSADGSPAIRKDAPESAKKQYKDYMKQVVGGKVKYAEPPKPKSSTKKSTTKKK